MLIVPLCSLMASLIELMSLTHFLILLKSPGDCATLGREPYHQQNKQKKTDYDK